MKYAVLVLSCFKDKANGTNKAILETWGKSMPDGWDLRIFMGGSSWIPENDPAVHAAIGEPGTLAVMDPVKAAPFVERNSDGLYSQEVSLPSAPDTYLGLAWKGKEARRWALDHNYAGIFMAMADTYVRMENLAKARDMFKRPAVGHVFPAAASKGYPIAKVPCPHGGFGYWLSRNTMEAISTAPIRHYSEDQNVAFALHKCGIKIHHDPRLSQNNLHASITSHLSTKWQAWDARMIYYAYKREQHRIALLETYGDKVKDWDGRCPRCHGYAITEGNKGPRCRHCGFRIFGILQTIWQPGPDNQDTVVDWNGKCVKCGQDTLAEGANMPTCLSCGIQHAVSFRQVV